MYTTVAQANIDIVGDTVCQVAGLEEHVVRVTRDMCMVLTPSLGHVAGQTFGSRAFSAYLRTSYVLARVMGLNFQT